MTVGHRIEDMLSRVGIFGSGWGPRGRGKAPIWAVACKCGTVEKLMVASDSAPEFIQQRFTRKGWRFHGGKAVCPTCLKTHPPPKQVNGHEQPQGVNMPAEQPIKTVPLATLGKVLPYINSHYDEEDHRYRDGWSDAFVSKETGFSIEIVKGIRESVYGQMSDPAVVALRSDIDSMQAMLDDLRRRCDALEKRR